MFLEEAVENLNGKPIRLHLGSGDIYLEGWINCDLYGDKADVKIDCSKIPLPDNSVQEIYACHLLEHFDFHEAFDVLREWKRVLKPKGLLRIETPDLLKSCRAFVGSDEQGRINLYSHFFSEPWIPGQIHKFLYTETQLRWTLEDVGFKNIRTIPASRYIGRENVCLGVECKKGEEINSLLWHQEKIVWRYPLVGWYVHQKPTELIMLFDFLKGNKIKKVLEIGSANGGTAVFWANMIGDDGVVYSVDITPVDKCYKGTEYEKQIIEMIGDSHDQTFKQEIYDKVGKVDMLFIDGDHSYEGAKDDFNSFAHMVRDGGFIVLHDIVDSEYHRERGCFVATLWNEIKNEYKIFEFIDTQELPGVDTPVQSMGIGVVCVTTPV
jgi:predicted SAM-dependent methyltransferase/cephalosporin hydroxylase